MLPKDLAIGNNVYCWSFFNEISSEKSFIPTKTVSVTSTDRYTRNFFLPKTQSVSTPQNVFFTQAHCFSDVIFTQIYFSIRITHSSIKFSLFAFFNYQKFDDRPEVLFDLSPFWIGSKQIFLRDWDTLSHKTIPKNLEVTFTENILKKTFFSNSPIF